MLNSKSSNLRSAARGVAGVCAAAMLALAIPGAPPVSAADDIVIGASIPLSGPLAGFGSFQQWGYQHAVDEVNRKGGIKIDGTKRQVKLVLRDDKTDPNASSGNIETLIAERHKLPMVTGCDPVEAFKSVRPWKYVWDLFFDEPDVAAVPFKAIAAAGIKTNKKVAIIHDNGPDGAAVGGLLWPTVAKSFGYEVTMNASFPLDNTQFTSLIAQAKASKADVMLVDAVTPQAVSIRKQMQEAGYSPVVLDIEKGAEPAQFATALSNLSDGILVAGYWDPSLPYPGAANLEKQFEKDTGKSGSQHIADSYAAASILLDAIAAAGSTDPEKINAAIASTNKTYVVGPIKFGADHAAKLSIVEDQWKGGKTSIVWPKAHMTGKFISPLPN